MSFSSIAALIPQNSPPDSHLSDHSHPHDLPSQLQEDLRALGGVQAPQELWERVELQRAMEALDPVRAPQELWDRVQGQLAREESPQPQAAGRLIQGSFFRRRWTAAAAVLVLGGFAILMESLGGPQSVQDGPILAETTSESLRAQYRAKARFVSVDPAEMSPIARGLAGSLGGLMVEDDA